ncbi:MAG: response regulator [Myxococcales bacterium]
MTVLEPCKLLLVDDHVLFRDTLKLAFGPYPNLRVVGEASGFEDACQIAESIRADVALLDLKLRDGDGLKVLSELRRRQPELRVLIVSMVEDPYRVAEAFDAGASGYATKDEPLEHLAQAIQAVCNGTPYLSSRFSSSEVDACRKRAARNSIAVLTAREREVFDLVVQGLTSAQIGERLGTSPRTIETHRIRILHKLHAKSVLDLARIAAQRGLLKGWN